MNNFNLDSSRLHIHNERQFFFDNTIIESVQWVKRSVHSPDKLESPVIEKDRPWEHVTYFSTGSSVVIQDPADGLFKCWYEDWTGMDDQFRIDQDWHTGCLGYPSRVLFASSKDGVHWEKPEMDIVIENGQKTNIVLGDREFGSVHVGYVILDVFEKDPQHRFKMSFSGPEKQITQFMWEGTIEFASSPDGINWKRYKKAPKLDDGIIPFLDKNLQCYVLNTRHPNMYTVALNPKNPIAAGDPAPPYCPNNPSLQNKRRVFRTESFDLEHWSALQPILVPDDELDGIDDAYYAMVQYKTSGMWIGFLDVLHETDNTMDVQLIYSRDGRNFSRIKPGQPWLTTGPAESWNRYMVTMSSPPVEVGDELYFYFGGAKNRHDWWYVGREEGIDHPEAKDLNEVRYGLGLAKMKRDRFVSLESNAIREGIVVTRPFNCDGGKLLINAACAKGGYIQIAAANEAGDIIEGFEKDNCRAFTSDAVEHQIVWKEKKELPRGWVKLIFYLRDANLYTFEIE